LYKVHRKDALITQMHGLYSTLSAYCSYKPGVSSAQMLD
jgi:hypothetical protein